MSAEKDYELIGRFIYGAGRLNFRLALMMDRMGKPIVSEAPGDRIALVASAREADAMFARLPVSDADKAQFSALMPRPVTLGVQLDSLDRLSADDFADCAAGTAAALDALPRFAAIVDGLRA